MNTLWKKFFVAAPIALLAVTGCDDDGGEGNGVDSAVDGSVLDGGAVDGPVLGDGGPTGDAATGTDGGAGDAGGDAAPVNAACLPADPNNYPSTMFEANVAGEKMLLGRLSMLNSAMAEAETDLMKTVAAPALVAQFGAGSPSVKDATSAYYAAQLEGAGGVFEQFADASNNKVFSAGTNGGKYGNWVFNADGVDLRQQFDKGLMSALQYRRLVEISRQAMVTPADIDRMVAIMGAVPTFPNDATDTSVAKYAANRSVKIDQNSLYMQIKKASIEARAAAANPTVCAAELTDALRRIREGWEKALVATTLFYAADTQKKLMTANDEASKAAALHSIGEGMAFIHGFKSLTAQDRIITDAQIDAVLTELFAVPENTAITGLQVAMPYKFLTDVTQPLRLPAAIDKIKAVYGFTDAQVESFKLKH